VTVVGEAAGGESGGGGHRGGKEGFDGVGVELGYVHFECIYLCITGMVAEAKCYGLEMRIGLKGVMMREKVKKRTPLQLVKEEIYERASK
jgi:hypothetical protein